MVEKNKSKSKYFNCFDIVLISLLVVCVLITGISASALISKESEIRKLEYQVDTLNGEVELLEEELDENMKFQTQMIEENRVLRRIVEFGE